MFLFAVFSVFFCEVEVSSVHLNAMQFEKRLYMYLDLQVKYCCVSSVSLANLLYYPLVKRMRL